MKRLISKKIFMKFSKKQKVAGSVFIAALLISGSLLSSWQAFSDASSPEKFTTDLSGNKKSFFNVGEQGYLELKSYADSIDGAADKADIVLLLDGSYSMSTDLLNQARTAMIAFANGIQVNSDTRVSLVVFAGKPRCGNIVSMDEGIAVERFPITAINSQTARTNLINAINALDQTTVRAVMGSFYCLTGTKEKWMTGIGTAVEKATQILDASVRASTSQNAVLFSDGEEDAHNYTNGTYFNKTAAGNGSYGVNAGSPLDKAVKSNIKIFSVHYGASSNICDAYDIADPYATGAGFFNGVYEPVSRTANDGCALMRFIAAKTNNLTLPTGKTYLSNYGQATGIDNAYMYHVSKSSDNLAAMTSILNYISGVNGVPLKIYEKVDSHAQFEGFTSATDKGGRSYIPAQSDGSNNQKIFYFVSIPKSYYCSSGESQCINSAKKVTVSGATKYLIENNYLTLKIRFLALSSGKFDMDSNYGGCDVGNPVATGNWVSKVEYQDPRTSNSIYATKNFPALCTEFSNGLIAPINIMKTTYSSSQNLDDLDESKMKSYFEAGDTVYTVMEITDSSEKRTDFEILDELPNSASGNLVYKIKRAGDGKNFNGSASIYTSGARKYFRLTPSASDSSSPGYLLEGKTIIQYEYKI
jgi:hypothetical protein